MQIVAVILLRLSMHVRTMDPIAEYNRLTDEENRLALSIREIAARKKQLREDTRLRDRIEFIVAKADVDYKISTDALLVNQPNLTMRLSEDGSLILIPKKEVEALILASIEPALNSYAAECVLTQYKFFKKEKEVGDFDKKIKELMHEITDSQNVKNVMDITTLSKKLYEYIDNFNALLKQFKVNEDEFKALTIEGKSKLREIKRLEERRKTFEPEVREYQECLQTYGNPEIYGAARAKALGFVKILDENRTKLLSSVTSELNALQPKYDDLQSSTKTALGKDYEQMFQAYVMLKSVAGSGNYKDVLSAKKDLLDSCRNDNPEKAVGLFRKRVTESGYGLDRDDAARALAAVRRLNEITAMSLQNLVELDYKVSELAEKKDALSGKIC
jgi:hypothetical protein